MNFQALIFVPLCAVVVQARYSPLKTEYQWKYFDYVWKSPDHRDYYVRNGLYDPAAMAPIDVDRSMDGRTFVTVIGARGVPATVHTVSDIRTENGPLLEPYPSWSWYESRDCAKRITSVYRVAIDRCNRIWVLDTGVFSDERVCPAQLLVFDLHTDRLIFQKTIPDYIAQNRTGGGLLITPILEIYGKSCEDTTVYIADVNGNGLVIFDGVKFYRLESDVYRPEDRFVNFTIAGESFTLADGVLGMALSPPQYPHRERYLSFRPLASLSLYGVDTQSLKLSKENGGAGIRYSRGVNVLPSQASAMAFSQEGTLFFGMTREIAIGCWNIHRPLESEYFKIAIQDYERLQFASGMKVLARPKFFPENEEQLLVMTNRLQKIYAGTQNFNEVNFRVLRSSVRDLIAGTICDKPH